MWEVTKEKQHWFVIIDLSSKKHNGKYKSGFDEFYIPNSTKPKTNIIFALKNGASS